MDDDSPNGFDALPNAVSGRPPLRVYTSKPFSESAGSLRDFLSVMFRQLPIVSVIFGATVLGTMLWIWLVPDTYEISAKVMLRFAREAADPRTSLSPETTRVLPATRPDINTEAELIKSYALIEQVVTNLGLDHPSPPPVPTEFIPRVKYELKRAYGGVKTELDDLQIAIGLKRRLSPREVAIMTLIQGLKVESVRDSSVIKATITTNQRTGASRILNSLLDYYREKRLAVEKNSREIEFFAKQEDESRQNLLGIEKKLYNLKSKYDLSSLPDQVSLALHNQSTAERDGRDTEAQLAAAEAKLRTLQSQIDSESKTRVINETDTRNAQLDSLNQRRNDLELEKQKALGKFGADHPEIKSLDEQLARVSKLISETQASVPQSRTTAVNSTYLDLEKEFLNTQQSIDSQRAQLSAQNMLVADYRSKIQQLREAGLAYDQLSRDVAHSEETYKLSERNAVEARAEEGLRSEGVTSVEVVDPAVDPILPSGIRKIYLLGGALLVGLILAIGAAIILDSLDHSVHTPVDVERFSGLEVVGYISYATSALLLIPPKGRYVREFGALASRLDREVLTRPRHYSRYARPWMLAVCGAGAGSRPEVIAAGVAHTLGSELGRKTLLVGVDDGFGKCAKLFGKEEEDFSNDKVTNVNESLDLLYMTSKRDSGGDADLADRIRSLCAAYQEYERILINLGSSPPETWLAAGNRDISGIVLVAEADRTRREVLAQWERSARGHGYRLVGAVLNGRRYSIPEVIYRWG